jgi:hypothetical protein
MDFMGVGHNTRWLSAVGVLLGVSGGCLLDGDGGDFFFSVRNDTSGDLRVETCITYRGAPGLIFGPLCGNPSVPVGLGTGTLKSGCLSEGAILTVRALPDDATGLNPVETTFDVGCNGEVLYLSVAQNQLGQLEIVLIADPFSTARVRREDGL